MNIFLIDFLLLFFKYFFLFIDAWKKKHKVILKVENLNIFKQKYQTVYNKNVEI